MRRSVLPNLRRSWEIFISFLYSEWDLFEKEFKTNVIAPVALLRAFTPLLNKGTAKKAVFFTTHLASLTDAERVPMLGASIISSITCEILASLTDYLIADPDLISRFILDDQDRVEYGNP